jgi:hypothetical protein
MIRKLLYTGLVLVNLLPFIYGFTKGYSLRAPFVNLIAFAAGKEYDAWLFLLVLMALLLPVVVIFASASAITSGSAKKHVIMNQSDGRRIAEENKQKLLHLQQLLQEAEHEQTPKAKRLLADPGLDMNIS